MMHQFNSIVISYAWTVPVFAVIIAIGIQFSEYLASKHAEPED